MALTLNFSAYFSEIVWAGLKTVNKGQIEAAKPMGLPRWKILWTILLPQAIAKMFPSLNAQFVFLFLTTGIMSEISVMDLTYAGVFIDSRTFRSFEVFLTLTILYILISLVFKFLCSYHAHGINFFELNSRIRDLAKINPGSSKNISLIFLSVSPNGISVHPKIIASTP